jgi:hypothetical protein
VVGDRAGEHDIDVLAGRGCSALRRTVYGRSTALAARDLRIKTSPLGNHAGLLGAAFLVADQVFSRDCLGQWLHKGSPVGLPGLSTAVAAA